MSNIENNYGIADMTLTSVSQQKEPVIQHPSFVVPNMFDKENDHHRHHGHHGMIAPVTPGTKPIKSRAVTTGKKKTLLHEKAVRVPLSSRTNRHPNHHAHAMNPFGGCDVSLHGDYTSLNAVGSGTVSKAAAKPPENDSDSVVSGWSAHLYHVGGPIRTGAARVRTPHAKARTPLAMKRMGVDGTYQTPSKELLRSTVCSRGHELPHHPIHHDNHIQTVKKRAITTGGKKQKAREVRARLRQEHGHRDGGQQRLDDISLRVPHVTFRGQEVADNTFDADLEDDVSALSIHLGCHAATAAAAATTGGAKEDGGDIDNESIDMSLVEAMKGEKLHTGEIILEGDGSERDCVRNPVATTLHIEHFVRQIAGEMDQQSPQQQGSVQAYINPLLPVFTGRKGIASSGNNRLQGVDVTRDVIRPVAIKARRGQSLHL